MNILLLTDFSKNAKNAHSYALEFFKGAQVHFNLMHVKKSCQKTKCSGSCKTLIQSRLEKEAASLRQEFPATNFTFQTTLLEGNLMENVREKVNQKQADFVVMGALGKSSSVRKNLGGNTFEIAIKVKCPVLIVFEKTRYKPLRKVAFPVDYTDKLHTNCFRKIKSLPNIDDLQINLFEIKHNNPMLKLQEESKTVLYDALSEIEKNTQKIDRFKLQEVDSYGSFDLVLLAAKNLAICNGIFAEMTAMDLTKKPIPSLLILHA
ncbi:MAG: universal stress protein [Bacteroidota bacterium]